MLGVTLSFYIDSLRSSRLLDLGLLIFAYIVLIPTLLIGWLILPHRVMLEAREVVLQPLTDEYHKVISKMKSVASEDTATIAADTERLSALTQRYKLWRDTFPVWPLEIVQIRQLLIAFILPVFVGLLTAIPSIPGILKYFAK